MALRRKHIFSRQQRNFYWRVATYLMHADALDKKLREKKYNHETGGEEGWSEIWVSWLHETQEGPGQVLVTFTSKFTSRQNY